MLQTLERYLLDPVSEDASNSPLELTGRDSAHGIHLGSVKFPEPEQTGTRISGRDVEGDVVVGEPSHRNRSIPFEVRVAEQGGIGLPAPLTNIVLNPGVETDTFFWNALTGGTLTRVTTQHVFGVAALQVVTTATANAGANYVGSQAPGSGGGTAEAGVPISALVALKGNAGGESVQISLGVAGTDATQTTVALTNKWNFYRVTWTPSAQRTSWNLLLRTPTATAITFFVDAVTIVVGASSVGEYIDGSQPGSSWVGTVNDSPSIQKQAVNKVLNPSFEVGTTGWSNLSTATNDAFAISTAWAKQGESSLHARWHGTATGQYAIVASQPITDMPVTGGTTYSFRADLNLVTNASVPWSFNVRWWDSAGAQINTVTVATTSTLGEQVVSGTAVAPAGAVSVTCQLGWDAPLVANEIVEFYVDGISVVAVPVGGGATADYWDGDVAGANWVGTPHASASLLYGSGSDRDRFVKTLYHLELKLQKLAREGGTLKRYLPDGTYYVFDVVGAKLTGDNWDRPFNQGGSTLQFELEAKPYARLAPVTLSAHSETTAPALVFPETAIPGDVPALADLAIRDIEASGKQRKALFMGARYRNYDPATTAKLMVEAESLTLGTGSTVQAPGTSPAGSSGNASVKSGTLSTLIFNTVVSGNLTHVGTYRVLARMAILGGVGTVFSRLRWSPRGATTVRFNPQVTVTTATWAIYDLGLVDFPRAPADLGNQGAFIGVDGELAPAGTMALYVDAIFFVPTEVAFMDAEAT